MLEDASHSIMYSNQYSKPNILSLGVVVHCTFISWCLPTKQLIFWLLVIAAVIRFYAICSCSFRQLVCCHPRITIKAPVNYAFEICLWTHVLVAHQKFATVNKSGRGIHSVSTFMAHTEEKNIQQPLCKSTGTCR